MYMFPYILQTVFFYLFRILLEDFSRKSSFQDIVEGQEFTALETVWHTMSVRTLTQIFCLSVLISLTCFLRL